MASRKAKLTSALGLGLLMANAGCGSMMHRSTVPPAPRSPRLGGGESLGGGVGFNSEPHPSQGGQLRPGGPVTNTGSPAGGLYGKAPNDSELGGAPLGEPEATPGVSGSSAPPPSF